MSSLNDLEKLAKNNPAIRQSLAILHSEAGKMNKIEGSAKDLISKLLNLKGERPKTYSIGSCTPYYKEKFAKPVRKALEEFQKEINESETYKKRLIEAKSMHMSRESFFKMFEQAWLWLRENDVEKERWIELRAKVKMGRTLTGLYLCFKEKELPSIKGVTIEKEESRIEWKDELEKFITNGVDDTRLVIKDVILEDPDIAYINAMIEQSEGLFLKEISAAGFTIIMNKAVWNEMRNL
jgi:hypothetical protein